MARPVIYLTNRQLLAEIATSKNSYTQYVDPIYAAYHRIVEHPDAITPAMIDEVAQRTRLPVSSLVFRVYTLDFLPLDPEAPLTGRSRLKSYPILPFRPFRHVLADGTEVGRSFWRGDFDVGVFDLRRGQMTDQLVVMLQTLVTRYSLRHNWRCYSFVDDMRQGAIMQLMRGALSFDESKSSNPFAYFTSISHNAFLKTLREEKHQHAIRDDLLEFQGITPSCGRQFSSTPPWTTTGGTRGRLVFKAPGVIEA